MRCCDGETAPLCIGCIKCIRGRRDSGRKSLGQARLRTIRRGDKKVRRMCMALSGDLRLGQLRGRRPSHNSGDRKPANADPIARQEPRGSAVPGRPWDRDNYGDYAWRCRETCGRGTCGVRDPRTTRCRRGRRHLQVTPAASLRPSPLRRSAGIAGLGI
jgi:hypothetical protein